MHWLEQVRIYNTLKPGQPMANVMKQMLLENAVNPIEELHAVKNTAQLLKVTSGNDPTFEQYCTLLATAAIQYDSANGL